ncbi:MAG TPA: GNAT family N-acetyltransferase [Candidatus Sulfopaludibacter sp.]|jgi:ribosomal protein S18 acetylase RimI-like enzyme|nr:GNAT family N-acetyltransferase [Candidatus Sulfopaludibacter sp.]
MAARLNPAPRPVPPIVDLRSVSAMELESILQEETAAWRVELDWDFDKSADLVRRFVDLRALNGSALVEDGAVTGYLYYVLEENKGLVGDLYVRADLRTKEREDLLLQSALDAISANPYIRRVESQLMMLAYDPDRVLPHPEIAHSYDRNFMRVELPDADLTEGRVRRPMYIERWTDLYQDDAAVLIAKAYTGHVDSRINDQYRTVMGARRFLHNIVEYPGCGTFYRTASYAAFEAASGRMCGISLASLVAPECGHITQICVSPEVRGTGIGHALLRRSLMTLREVGCKAASLTVTSANEDAVALYERVGFRTIRKFSAFAWER